MFMRLTIVLFFCKLLIISGQIIEPVGDMYDPRLPSIIVPNTTLSSVVRDNPFDTIDLGTVYAGEFYRFQLRLADNSTRISFQSEGTPRGWKVGKDGVVQGITYDQGWFYVRVSISFQENVSEGVLKVFVKGEPMQSYHYLLDSLFFYPNPFQSIAHMDFYLDEPYRVSIKVFDSKGNLVKLVDNQRHKAGSHHITWDGTDDQEERIMDGWYHVQFSVFDRRGFVVTNTRRMLKMTRDYQRFW